MSKVIKADGFQTAKDEAGWTGIPNDVIREPRLSVTARSLFGILASFSADFEFSFDLLPTYLGVSRSTYNRAMNELERAGLAQRRRYKVGTTWDWDVVLVPDYTAWVEWKADHGQLSKIELIQNESIKEEHSKKNPLPHAQARFETQDPTLQSKHKRLVDVASQKLGTKLLDRPKPKNKAAIPEAERPTYKAAIDPDLPAEQFVIDQFAFFGHKLNSASAMSMAMRWQGSGKTRNDFADKLASLHADAEVRYSTQAVTKFMLQDASEKKPERSVKQPSSRPSYRPQVDPGPGYENRLNADQYVLLPPEPEKKVDPEEQRLIELAMTDKKYMDDLMDYYERKKDQHV